MFNVKCCKLHDRRIFKLFKGMLLNGHPGNFVIFEADCQKMGLSFSWWGVLPPQKLWHGGNFIVFVYKRWVFIGRFEVGTVPGTSVALEASKNRIKIHHEYDARPLTKSYNCY